MNELKTSNLQEFEKQLEQIETILDLDESPKVRRLNEIALNETIRKSVVPVNVPVPAPASNSAIQNLMKLQKNVVLCYISDATGCGFIRCFQPFSYLNFVFGKSQQLLPIISSAFIHDDQILIRTRTIFFQRQMSPQHLQMVAWYKQKQAHFQYKMVWEMDDHIWWEDKEKTVNGVPPYNFGAPGITNDIKNSSIEIMKMMDLIVVSTEFLAQYIRNELGVKVPIKVIPNHVAKYFWKDGICKTITEKIKKPKIIYTGSPTHYNNEKKMYGDWVNPAWRDFIIKGVRENKISFTCMGGLPWFFEEIKDKIKVIDWLNSFQYHLAVLGERADFGLMPLVPNNFNRGKSNLKYLEYCAAGIVGIGTYFTDKSMSPYDSMDIKLPNDCSLNDIENIIEEYSHPDKYNAAIDRQFKFLDDNGHWLESKKYIDNFLKIL